VNREACYGNEEEERERERERYLKERNRRATTPNSKRPPHFAELYYSCLQKQYFRILLPNFIIIFFTHQFYDINLFSFFQFYFFFWFLSNCFVSTNYNF